MDSHDLRDETSQDSWTRICRSPDVPHESVRACRIGKQALAVWRDAAGDAHVWLDRCPHRGDALSTGCVSGALIVCASHGWRFDINGQQIRPIAVDAPRASAFATIFPVCEADGWIAAQLHVPVSCV